MSPLHRNVVAIVGENGNEFLAAQSASFMEYLRPHGFAVHVVDLRRPDAGGLLERLAGEGIAFGWGFAGVGCRLESNGTNLWNLLKRPFVSVLADPPFAKPINHHVDSRYVINGYVYHDWLQFQKRYIGSSQISSIVRMGILPNPDRDLIPCEKRPIRMAFVKNAGDPEQRRANWKVLPTRLREAMEDAAEVILRQGTGDIVGPATEVFDSAGLYIEQRRELLFFLLQELDVYVREARATAVARALLPLPAEIYGSGWDHLMPEAEGARAVVRPGFHAAHLDSFYAKCHWLVNTTPNFTSGAHERVLSGFAAGCAVVSDINNYARTTLSELPSFRGLIWNADNLTDQLADTLADRTFVHEATAPAADFVEREFDPRGFVRSIIDLAAVAELSAAVTPAFPPEAR